MAAMDENNDGVVKDKVFAANDSFFLQLIESKLTFDKFKD